MSYYFGGSKHGIKTTSNKSLTTKERIPKHDPIDGELYYGLYQVNSPHCIIGEAKGSQLHNGYRNIVHRNILEPVGLTGLQVYILNSDGKQKGRELIDQHMGETFDVVDIGSHEKYKYIIEIEDEKIALSASNVVFINDLFEEKLKTKKQQIVTYKGTDFILHNKSQDFGHVVYTLYDPGTNVYFYVPPGEITEAKETHKILLLRTQINELQDKNYDIVFNFYISETVENFRKFRSKYGFSYLDKHKGNRMRLDGSLVDTETFEKIKKEFEGRYYYTQGIFALNPKHRDKIKMKGKPNPRFRGGRGMSAEQIREELI